MTNNIHFTKMHGLGNDYIYVNNMKYPIENPEEFSKKWSAFHTGIGSDGLVLIGDSDKADFSMRIFNADGSEALMCGNATRCIAKYVYEKGLTQKKEISLETLSGIKVLHLKVVKGIVEQVTVDMGLPIIKSKLLPISIEGEVYNGVEVSMGNPHFVLFVEDIEKVDIATVGSKIENHPYFKDRTNVEFVQILNKNLVRMRVWERGSGITMACGTGACATAVAVVSTYDTVGDIRVIMDGGLLDIAWEGVEKPVMMTGGATTVFEGVIAL